jgi:hypothetical protein
MRTVRVPDDGKVHNLPPGLGRCPLFNIASFEDRVPQEMLSKGDIFLPIYRMRPIFNPNVGPGNFNSLTKELQYRARSYVDPVYLFTEIPLCSQAFRRWS